MLIGCRYWFFFLPLEQFHLSELLIGDAQYSNASNFRKGFFDPLNMYFGVFTTGAMSQIYRKLKHGKTIVYQFLAEIGVCLLLLFGFRW